MKLLGLLMVAYGFLSGAYFLTGAGGSVLGIEFARSFTAALIGVIILRVVTRKRVAAVEKVTAEVQTAERSLKNLCLGTAQLDQEKTDIYVYDLPGIIDQRFMADLEAFVEARESIAIAHGLSVYAEVMSHFAAGERYLNRVWSCSVDGYVDEAHTFIERAKDQFEQGLDKLVDRA
jgi:hypothetical protein